MTIIGGARIRWILHHFSAGLLLDTDFLFTDLALFTKNAFHLLVTVTTSMLGNVGKTAKQEETSANKCPNSILAKVKAN